MARALLPIRVARKDGEWTVDRHSDHLLRVRVNDDGTADLAIALNALPIQPLTRSRPFQLGQALIGSVLINVLDRVGLNLGHSGVIRIRVRRHFVSACARSSDYLEHLRRLGKADAIPL